MSNVEVYAKMLLQMQEDLSFASEMDGEVTIAGNGVNSSEAYLALKPVFREFARLFGYEKQFEEADQKGKEGGRQQMKEWGESFDD